MQRKFKLGLGAAAVLATALTLSACGGDGGSDVVTPPVAGGGGSTVDPTMVPDSAGATVASFIAFIQSLALNDETSEPLTFSASFTPPPEDNNSEPASL